MLHKRIRKCFFGRKNMFFVFLCANVSVPSRIVDHVPVFRGVVGQVPITHFHMSHLVIDFSGADDIDSVSLMLPLGFVNFFDQFRLIKRFPLRSVAGPRVAVTPFLLWLPHNNKLNSIRL